MALPASLQKKTNKVIGKGIKFPFRFGSNGGVVFQSSDTDLEATEMINQSLAVIIGTAIGERFIRRDFGSVLYALVDEPIDSSLRSRIGNFLLDSIKRLERRIIVESQKIDFSLQEEGVVQISFSYTIIKTQKPGNFVYPFYLNNE